MLAHSVRKFTVTLLTKFFFLDFLLNVLVKAIAGYYVIVIYLQVLVFVYQLLYFIREKCFSPFVGTVAVCTNVCI